MPFLQEDYTIITQESEEKPGNYNVVAPSISMSSIHNFNTMEDYFAFDRFQDGLFLYGRNANPTTTILEKKIAKLEKGAFALMFSSGMAAVTAAINAYCKTGSHIICVRNSYGCVKEYLDVFCIRHYKMAVTYISGQDLAELEAAITPQTHLLMLESPTSFVFDVLDLKAIVSIAKKHGIKTYIDNTYCTPIFQKPLSLGIDMVMHTASKYLGGHSDIIGGVLVSNDTELMKTTVNSLRELHGAIMGPMEAWLVMRGMRTLMPRLAQHQSTAMNIAQYLQKHPKVAKVNYPGLFTHPQYALAKVQQTGNSGLMSFVLDADMPASIRFVNALKQFKRACSWGGYESLALLPLHNCTPEHLTFLGAERHLIRIHCGLDGADNLVDDLELGFRSM